MSRHVEIRFVTPSLALVTGPQTREMLTEMSGRPPVWSTLSRGWVTQPHRARDLVAILERRGGWDITVTNADGYADRGHVGDVRPPVVGHSDVEEEALW